MIERNKWPPHVTIRGCWYGCDTGCDGVGAFDDAGERVAFSFSTARDEADARDVLDIPDEIAVTFESGALDP